MAPLPFLTLFIIVFDFIKSHCINHIFMKLVLKLVLYLIQVAIIIQGVPINMGQFSDEFDIVFLNNSLI